MIMANEKKNSIFTAQMMKKENDNNNARTSVNKLQNPIEHTLLLLLQTMRNRDFRNFYACFFSLFDNFKQKSTEKKQIISIPNSSSGKQNEGK